jgi:hypothetical protein
VRGRHAELEPGLRAGQLHEFPDAALDGSHAASGGPADRAVGGAGGEQDEDPVVTGGQVTTTRNFRLAEAISCG